MKRPCELMEEPPLEAFACLPELPTLARVVSPSAAPLVVAVTPRSAKGANIPNTRKENLRSGVAVLSFIRSVSVSCVGRRKKGAVHRPCSL